MTRPTTNLTDNFSLRGQWWLPEQPDRKIPGEIIFEADGTQELSLDGPLKELASGPLTGLSAPLIHGHTINGMACNLIDTFEFSRQIHAPGGIATKVYYNHLLIGRELIDIKTAKFESALINFSNFGAWINRVPFSEKYNFDTNDPVRLKTVYQMPKTISTVVDSLKTSFRFESGFKTNHGLHERNLKHYESLRIQPQSKKSLDWYKDTVSKFRIFLMLLCGEPLKITTFKLSLKKNKISSIPKKWDREYLDYCAQQKGIQKTSTLLPRDIPFHYPLIRKNFRTYLNNWYDKSDNLKTVYELYFGVFISDGLPTEFKFLALLQALESYHRIVGKGKYLSDKSYEPIKEVLTKSIPVSVSKDFRDALKARIHYGNEYSLRKRLTVIFKTLPESFSKLIFRSESNFIQRVVNTRNYLTHRDESLSNDIMDFNAMTKACEKFKILINYLLLAECEMEPEFICDQLMSNDRIMKYVRI